MTISGTQAKKKLPPFAGLKEIVTKVTQATSKVQHQVSARISEVVDLFESAHVAQGGRPGASSGLILPFAQGAEGQLSPASDFSAYVSLADPTEATLSASQPMLLRYLRTGQFGEFAGEKGVPIRYGVFAPPPGVPVKGVINVLSGRTESFVKYAELLFNLRDLRAQGYVVAMMDHRGQGFSGREIDDPRKGHVEDFQDYVRDQKSFTNLLSRWYPGAPKSLVGHSMGGGISTRYLETHRGDYARAALLSPMLDIESRMPDALENPVSRLGGVLAPEAYMVGTGDYKPKKVTDSRQSQPRAELVNNIRDTFPETKLGGNTWGWLDEAVRASRQMTKPSELQQLEGIDLHIFTATDDELVEADAQDAFATALKLEQKHYSSTHELLFQKDPVRNQVLSDLRAVLLAPPK